MTLPVDHHVEEEVIFTDAVVCPVALYRVQPLVEQPSEVIVFRPERHANALTQLTGITENREVAANHELAFPMRVVVKHGIHFLTAQGRIDLVVGLVGAN